MTIKLSETQDAAIREVAELGYTVAKANTIKSLETKELILSTGGTHHQLTAAGREYLGLDNVEESVEEDFHTKLMADVAQLEEGLETLAESVTHEELKSLLQGDPWKLDEPLADWERELLDGAPEIPAKRENTEEKPFQYFDEAWNNAKRVEAGFGATLLFRNTHVWDGLTAKEIRADIKTALPIGRAGQRRAAKVQQKAATAVRLAMRELVAA